MTLASWTLMLGESAFGTLIYNDFTIHSAWVVGSISVVSVQELCPNLLSLHPLLEWCLLLPRPSLHTPPNHTLTMHQG